MKQSRRHELKTNELSIWLQQTYAAAGRNINYIIGGVVVVVLILVIALFVRNRRYDAREAAWASYYEIEATPVWQKPDVMDRARAFADEHAGDRDLGARSVLLLAGKAADVAMTLDPFKEADKRLAALNEAKKAYDTVIQDYADRPEFVVPARMGLATILESLVLIGQAGVEDVRKQYQAIVAEPESGAYQFMAGEALKDLNERLVPITLVATRPAGFSTTAPATRSVVPPPIVPATQPATSSAPAGTELPPSAPPIPPAEMPPTSAASPGSPTP